MAGCEEGDFPFKCGSCKVFDEVSAGMVATDTDIDPNDGMTALPSDVDSEALAPDAVGRPSGAVAGLARVLIERS